ncbi:MAG: NTP transferase domain-containing protein [Acidobacteria bacterium]|nr:NTP transferase domain-containing protein [Acidobacteriota bacterium]
MLTAGLGTRLRPLTDVRAKPALPVAGEPLIRRIIAWLAAQGVSDLVLNLHHRPETIAAVVGDGADLGARVRYSWEPRVLGSAGGPRLALPLIAVDTFLIVNGDTLTDLPLAPMLDAHAASSALVTLALVPNLEFDRYGGVALDDQMRVTGFPRRGPAARGSHHFIGVQIVQASAFAALIPGEPAASIGGVYDALIATRPGAVRGFVCDANFWDVGTPADYWRTSQALLAAGGDAPPGRNARIDPSARVTQSILWDDVEVGAGATLDECIVTDGVRVPAGAAHRRSILIARDDNIAATPLDL